MIDLWTEQMESKILKKSKSNSYNCSDGVNYKIIKSNLQVEGFANTHRNWKLQVHRLGETRRPDQALNMRPALWAKIIKINVSLIRVWVQFCKHPIQVVILQEYNNNFHTLQKVANKMLIKACDGLRNIGKQLINKSAGYTFLSLSKIVGSLKMNPSGIRFFVIPYANRSFMNS